MWVWFWWDCYIITKGFELFFSTYCNKSKNCPWIPQKFCWQLFSIIAGEQNYCPGTAKRLIWAAVIKVAGKKGLIGHRCSHPGDGGTKSGHPSPVPLCPPKVVLQNNGHLEPPVQKWSNQCLPMFPQQCVCTNLTAMHPTLADTFYGRTISYAPGHT